MKKLTRSIYCAAIPLFLLLLHVNAAVVIESRLEAEEWEQPLGYLFLEVGASEIGYSFWTSPSFESPGAIRIRGSDATRSLLLGEGRTVRFDYDSYGPNAVPENPFVARPASGGEPEWIPFDKDFRIDIYRIGQPAMTVWTEYSGKLENEEFASFLTGETGLLATMGALHIRRIEGAIVFSSFTLAEGELVLTSDLTGITAIPEPATTVLIAGGFIFLIGVGYRSFRGGLVFKR
ncbi:MAG TPA: hypothetical protein VK041_00280 [Opitutales bacterium]|nr:hypothetical protein [Opitutales bacterium]